MSNKTYLSYRSTAAFGVISSGMGNTLFSLDGKLVITPCLETVSVWDWKRGVLVSSWKDSENTAEVTSISRTHEGSHFAVGYSDGAIRIWNIETNICTITFNGHKSAITALRFDQSGSRLSSGSKDNDVVIWDIPGECGMYRLKGHKNQITGLYFLQGEELNHLVSTSKDSLLKVWDLTTQHCVETIIAHRSEIWALDASVDGKLLFTGAADQELRVWNIDHVLLKKKLEPAHGGGYGNNGESAAEIAVKDAITLRGVIERQSKERVLTLKAHPNGRFIAVQATDKTVEVYKVRNEEELRKRLARKKKRQREKLKSDGVVMVAGEELLEEIVFEDEIVRHGTLRCTGKVRSFDFAPPHKMSSHKDGSFTIVCALSNNSIEVYSAGTEEALGSETVQLLSSLDLQGHRSDVRTLALSTDNELLVSGSNNSIKVWNVNTKECIKTIDSGYALCSTFVPGNKHVIIGTKTGDLEIYDLASSSCLQTIKAHEDAIWSLEVRPDKTGLTTGSADKDVKFWDFSLVAKTDTSSKQLTLIHTRTLKMSEDVLCIRHSPDGRLLAVSLLDSTVKVFFCDTLKFSLSLYGHKLPILSMDITSDSTMIATASADKSIKLWGLDFGDCHRSIYAHQDSVMACKFVWGTHYLFSASKDKCIKYWDGDKFEQIMKLEGHHGEVWALAVAKFGAFVVTGSHDRSIRIWTKTDEQLFLEEEREKELDRIYEKKDTQDDNERFNLAIGSGADGDAGDIIRDPSDQNDNMVTGEEVGAAGKKTLETLKSGEKLMEALEVWQAERGALNAYHEALEKGSKSALPPTTSPFILALREPDMTPEGYVMHIVERIKSSDLEQALIILPFVKIEALLHCISVWSEKNFNIQLTSRILTYILRMHFNQITSSTSSAALQPILEKIKENSRFRLTEWKDRVGFNLSALKLLSRSYEEEHFSEFMDRDADTEIKEVKAMKGSSRKRKINITSQ